VRGLGLVAGREKLDGATDRVTRGRDHDTDNEGSGVGPSSVRVGVRGGVANREFGGGLVTTG
jgi:hypothetical protein